MENYTFLSVIFYLISPDNIRYCRGLIVNMTSHELTCLFNLSTRNQCDQLIMFFQAVDNIPSASGILRGTGTSVPAGYSAA